MVNLARLAGFDDDAESRSFRAADEMMMHGAASEQRADRNAIYPGLTVRQNDDTVTLVDRLLGFGADPIERSNHPAW